jgi:hypothetical protein
MKIKKEILKVLSMSFLLSSLAVTSPVVTTVTHAAGPHGGNGIDDKRDEDEKKKREEEEKRNREEAKKKENEERMKEITQRVVQVEVKDEGAVRKEVTESLLKDLPPEFLEMYDNIGGKIRIVDGNLAEQPGLKGLTATDINGKEVSLDDYYVHTIKGPHPVLEIQASDDYKDNIEKRTNVYYEIGKSFVRDLLKSEVFMDSSFLDAVNKINDSDAKDLLFSTKLKEHKDLFNETYVKEHIKDFQDIFAKAFAYYKVPESQELLKAYAPSLYKYFEKLDWRKLKEGVKKVETLDFKSDISSAEKWAQQNYGNWRTSLESDELKAIDYYTKGGFMVLNEKLRIGSKINPNSDSAKNIKLISQALERKRIPTEIIVYRGAGENILGDSKNLLKTQKGRQQLIGEIFIEKGFMSTSILRDKAFGKDIILYLTVPAGTKGAYVGINSTHDEKEILIDKGYQYKINSIDLEPETRKWRIRAEILPKEEM